MTTLILPCAGRSSRFNGMKPKWLLTYPDGELMIQKAVHHMDLDRFDRIAFAIVREHDQQYDASIVLRQAFADRADQIEICVLEQFTSGPAETVARTIDDRLIQGPVVIKDADNAVEYDKGDDHPDFVVGSELGRLGEVSNVPGKSFLSVNDQGLIVDIVEKKIVSDIISLGVYGFADANYVTTAFDAVAGDSRASGEIFLSHLISYLIHSRQAQYEFVQAASFEDWGTIDEWRGVQRRHRTLFCDVDGVIYRNRGRYGVATWNDPPDVIHENVEVLKRFVAGGGQLILATSRPPEFRAQLEGEMRDLGLRCYEIILGLNHAQRIIVNDFAPTNPYPSCTAVSLPRDGLLQNYFFDA